MSVSIIGKPLAPFQVVAGTLRDRDVRFRTLGSWSSFRSS
jgi:hypothetical protein